METLYNKTTDNTTTDTEISTIQDAVTYVRTLKKIPPIVFVIDVHYLFNKTIFAFINGFKSQLSKDEKILSFDETNVNAFMRKIATDMFSSIAHFFPLGSVSYEYPIILANDSKSWRKDIYPEYKAHRNKQDTSSMVDWDVFHSCIKEFCEIAAERNFIPLQVPGAEADDIIAVTTNILNKSGISTIVISGDGDFNQIAYTPKDLDSLEGFNIIFNNNSKIMKLIVAQGFVKLMEESEDIILNSFDDTYTNKDTLNSVQDFIKEYISDTVALTPIDNETRKKLYKKNLVNSFYAIASIPVNQRKTMAQDIDIIEVNPLYERYKKILSGDSGDNISAMYHWNINDRKYSLTQNMATDILKEYKNYLVANNIINEDSTDISNTPEMYLEQNLYLDVLHTLVESRINKRCEKKTFDEFIESYLQNKRLASLGVGQYDIDNTIIINIINTFIDTIKKEGDTIKEPTTQRNSRTFYRGTKYYSEPSHLSTIQYTDEKLVTLKPKQDVLPKFESVKKEKNFSNEIDKLLDGIFIK